MRRNQTSENGHLLRSTLDSGGKRFPFCDLAANAAWHQLAALADTVVRWFQQTCLTGALKHARPKTLRWNLWHTPARLVRHARASTLTLPANRAATAAILNARTRINLLICCTHPHRRGRPQHHAGPTRPSAPRHKPPSPKTPHQAHTAPPTTPHTPGPPPPHARPPPQNTRKHTSPRPPNNSHARSGLVRCPQTLVVVARPPFVAGCVPGYVETIAGSSFDGSRRP